jgi:DNA-binding protein HU-beta
MNKRELVNAVAAHTGVDKKQVDVVLSGFTDVVSSVVSKGEPVAISGFAKFAKIERAARMGRNPATGETIKIAAKRVAKITPLKAFKDAALGVKAPAKMAPAQKAAPAKKAAAQK